MTRTVRLLAATILAFLVAGSPASMAQADFPLRNVRLIVSFPAGSATDLMGRLLADRLSRTWGVPVVVENVTGAAGQIGTGRVARADPDGYTLIVTPPAQLVTHGALYKNLNYDPAQFVPIALLAQVPYGLTVRKEPRLASVKDFVAVAQASPGKLTYATQGVGSTSHLTTKLFETRAKIELLHVPYRGSAPALNDLVAGTIDAMFDNLGNSLALHNDGRVQIIAVADDRRARSLPDVPTFSEAGFPAFRSITWFALAAPPKTSGALVAKINSDVLNILSNREVQDRLRALELAPIGMGVAETEAFIKDEAMLWRSVIRDANVQSE